MKPLLSENKEFIVFFSKLPPNKRIKLIDSLTKLHLDCIGEIFKNFLRNNLTDDIKTVKLLKRYQTEIRKVSRKSTPLYIKKKILRSKRGGSILSLLLPLASSIIGSIL